MNNHANSVTNAAMLMTAFDLCLCLSCIAASTKGPGDDGNKKIPRAQTMKQSSFASTAMTMQEGCNEKVEIPGEENRKGGNQEWLHAISIHTERFGRTYYLRAATEQTKNEWLSAIDEAVEADKQHQLTLLQLTCTRKFKVKLRHFYDSNYVQNFVAILLVINFGINVYDAESQPQPGTKTRLLLDEIDNVFTAIYSIELLVNVYTHWFWSFFTNKWSLFDFFVVWMSIIESIVSASKSSAESSGGSPLSMVRLLRIFRVVRLFNKLKSLQRVILGISSTIIPMGTSVKMCLYCCAACCMRVLTCCPLQAIL